jgi:hypothetical protein
VAFFVRRNLKESAEFARQSRSRQQTHEVRIGVVEGEAHSAQAVKVDEEMALAAGAAGAAGTAGTAGTTAIVTPTRPLSPGGLAALTTASAQWRDVLFSVRANGQRIVWLVVAGAAWGPLFYVGFIWMPLFATNIVDGAPVRSLSSSYSTIPIFHPGSISDFPHSSPPIRLATVTLR